VRFKGVLILIQKSQILASIVQKLNHELQTIELSAQAALEAATHEESKAEDQHDTRGLEASYLARAQASRAAELNRLLLIFKLFPIREYTQNDPIVPGALIGLELNQKLSLYFLVTHGGGTLIEVNSQVIQLITPQSPLGDALLGKKQGDIIEIESRGSVREYKIVSVD